MTWDTPSVLDLTPESIAELEARLARILRFIDDLERESHAGGYPVHVLDHLRLELKAAEHLLGRSTTT